MAHMRVLSPARHWSRYAITALFNAVTNVHLNKLKGMNKATNKISQ